MPDSRKGEVRGRAIDAETAAAALTILVDGLPPERAENSRRGMLEVLREAYRSADVPLPDWMKG